MRRLRGPVGGAVLFLAVAGLVVGGLGWVTVAALRVEAAQLDAAAQADQASNLRVALYRLDLRISGTLGLEDSRPYDHYAAVHAPFPALPAADPEAAAFAALRVPSPLLAGQFPDWMRLHFQIDPRTGWESPQVPPTDVADRLVKAGADLPPEAVAAARSDLLARVRAELPARDVAATLAARELALPSDSPPLAAPLLWQDAVANADAVPPQQFDANSLAVPQQAVPQQTPQPVPTADPKAAPVRVFGVELSKKEAPPAASNTVAANGVPAFNTTTNAFRGNQQAVNPQTTRGGGRQGLDLGNNEWQARAGVMSRGLTEQKGAYDNFAPVKNGNTTYAYGQALANGAVPPGPLNVANAATLAGGKEAKESAADLKKAVPAGKDAPTQPPASGPAPGIAPKSDPAATPPATLTPPPPPTVAVHLGAMRPHWLPAAGGAERLALVRAARLDDRVVYQGVLLDWDRLQGVLKDEVRDLFPDARLVPVHNPSAASPERTMAALPVQLDPGPAAPPAPAGWTTLRLGLVIAWVAALVALAAVGLGGWSLIDLSERRIRFVSAVTHELRTPLTSLRLYLDLLTSGMISDEAKQKEYLGTLHAEADRLHRLIDNVLDFARLENRARPADKAPARVADLLDQVGQTWRERCAADGRELVVVNTLPPDRVVVTDPHLLGQVVGNLIDNARKYARDAADSRIWLWAKPGDGKHVVFEVEDRGPGVAPRERASVFRPFRRGAGADTTAGGAGLGLALARQWAAALGGRLAYRPADGGVGACFRLELPA